MQTTIESDRLQLRPFQDSDVEAIVNVYNDPRVEALDPSIRIPYLHEHASEYIRLARLAYETNQGICFAIDADGLIGCLSLTLPRIASIEVGYAIAPNHWGKGLATEALKLGTLYAHQMCKAHRVEAIVLEANIGSRRVLTKAGYLEEGHARDFFGPGQDGIRFARLATDPIPEGPSLRLRLGVGLGMAPFPTPNQAAPGSE